MWLYSSKNGSVDSSVVFRNSNFMAVLHLIPENRGKKITKRFDVNQLKDAAGN